MKKLLSTALLIFLFGNLFSQNAINDEQAMLYAQKFGAKIGIGISPTRISGDNAGVFIFNYGDKGFVMLSASKSIRPVLAYSNEFNIPSLEDAPDNITWWIGQYEEQVAYAMKHPEVATEKTVKEWKSLEDGTLSFDSKGVNPLCTTLWDQGCYYNALCPQDYGGPCNHVYAGCVACAMAQVMKYHNHPAQGYGSHTYTYGDYGTMTANFGSTTYDWNNMPTEIHNQNNAVATLLYHCGVSVDMMYSPSGSGAQSNDVETALRCYFGYCGATYKTRTSYTDEQWIALIKNELDNDRPLYYSGSGNSSGHAFVCDGYNDSNYFHFNWGWSGSANGYFSLDDLMGFNGNQSVVINITPMVITPDANGIIYVTPDGEGDGSSWSNATSKLHYAAARSNTGVRLWVKKGTYYGDESDNINAFNIYASNRIYGSFNGDEPADYDITLRDFVNNATILDGQNSKRVLNQGDILNAPTNAIWDGFTLRNGNSITGAGAYLNDFSTLANCTIIDNSAEIYGGGVYANASTANNHIFLTNCTISGNSTSIGGGICDRYGVVYSNCRISNNTASTKGGGIYLYSNAQPILKSCVISNNSAVMGGGMYARGRFIANNCDFVMNSAVDSAGGVFNENERNKYYSCILWGNTADNAENQYLGPSIFEYCAVQGECEGTGNINLPASNDGSEPGVFVRFAQPSQGTGSAYSDADWSIMPRSICLNAGKPNATGLGSYDIAGNLRIQKGRVDIGAYESCSPLNSIVAEICDNEPYNLNGTEITTSGYYTALFETGLCDSVVGLSLTVFEAPETSITGKMSIQHGESTTLTAHGASSYLWSTGETTESITVTPQNTTTYTVTGSNEICTDQAEATVYVGGSDVDDTEINVTIAPNPADSYIVVDAESLKHISVYNFMGQRVENMDANNGCRIDVSQYNNGIYFFVLETSNGSTTRKVVIDR